MRLMCIFCLLFVGLVGAANATSSSNEHNGAIDYNGVKDRYDCIHHIGTLAPRQRSIALKQSDLSGRLTAMRGGAEASLESSP